MGIEREDFEFLRRAVVAALLLLAFGIMSAIALHLVIGGSPYAPLATVLYMVMLVVVVWYADNIRRKPKPGICRRCGYDLRGNPAARTCPECGRQLSRRELSRPRRGTGDGRESRHD